MAAEEAIIREHMQLDLALYDHANSIMDTDWARTVKDRSNGVLCRMHRECAVTCEAEGARGTTRKRRRPPQRQDR